MTRDYLPLTAHPLQAGARHHLPGQDPQRVRIDSPALAVMTDLRQIPAATIDLEAPLDAANRFMIRRGVRLLLVTTVALLTATSGVYYVNLGFKMVPYNGNGNHAP